MDSVLSLELVDHLQCGVALLDHQGRIQLWNHWMERYSRRSRHDVIGQRFDEVFAELAQTRFTEAIEQALRSGLSSVLTPGLNARLLPLYQHPEHVQLTQRIQALIYIAAIPRNHTCLIQVQDMTATMRRERRLRAQSTQLIATTYLDALTGVGNRRRFDRDLNLFFASALETHSSIAMLMIDIDDFKAYNDHLGHVQGDACLIQVANALRGGLRQQSESLSRYGGEEFALPLTKADRDVACVIAERLRQIVEDLKLPHPASRVGHSVTVTIGVSAMVPEPGQPSSVLTGRADLALYRAKDAGRNRCLFHDPNLASDCFQRVEQITDLPLES